VEGTVKTLAWIGWPRYAQLGALFCAGVGIAGCGQSANLGGPGEPSGSTSGSASGATSGSASGSAPSGASGAGELDGSMPSDGSLAAYQDAAPLALADLCPIYTQDLCTYLMQCSGTPYQNMAQCLSENTCYGLPDLTRAATEGAVVYDPTVVGQCDARFRADPCGFALFLFSTDIFDVLSYCPGALTPELSAGDACVSNGECASGLYCNKASGTCPGTCTAYSALGEPCDVNGLSCGQNLVCRSNACIALATVGSSCMTDSDCPSEICIGVDSGYCANLWCDPTTNTCAAGVGAGQVCGPTDAGANVACENDLGCVSLEGTGTCAAPGAAGAPCTFDSNCQTGLHCEGFVIGHQLGQCAAPLPLGASCNDTTACGAGLFCKYDAQGINGACAPPSGPGDSCTSSDSDCQPGLTCQVGATVNGLAQRECLTKVYPPAQCSDGGTSFCVESLCKNGQCVNYANVGDPCMAGGDCTTGACLGGQCADTTVCSNPNDGGP
jgi:hypothetical protein